jgi:uncharacterized protein YecT (DUF1311 family)
MRRSNNHIWVGIGFIFVAFAVALLVFFVVKFGASINRKDSETAIATAPQTPIAISENAQVVPQPAVVNEPDTAPPETSYNPSYDCRSDLANVLQIICGNEELSAKDRNLSTIFKEVLSTKTGEDRHLILVGQRAFLAERDQCQDEACLNEWYDRTTAFYTENL